ncbi:hypothetical protein JH06_2998 [Blastocystis sp. subtype 4]|uniref:hypothetical protein n=1 Tax=Blastocystis sp. subtype 4 TaxID=944170 RepID=UPI000711C8B2|nr:hypothetical protein JH06_2998 [Blastocystis sp. subtype 4]KNB46053.1 hypothetical protein JH06_2998 [Blastocystis sp. subtype 4]|eukprot:XP_014529528.1 hypothetical protein JH06_2998 [Blastocystis sp. subtype 4]
MDFVAKKENTDSKPEGEDTIVIREGNSVHFRVRNNTKMKKVFKNYSTKMGRDQSYFRFMFDGRCIGQDDTPESLGMEDGDHIDCELEQVGGY